MKSARVSVIKENIEKGTPIPDAKNDAFIGKWVDQEMKNKGHTIDEHGIVDMPEYGIDNKTRKRGSNASHTIGSMTDNNIIKSPVWEDTNFYAKSKNQNQVMWDPDFMEISNVKIVDMDIDLIQKNLREAYEDLRKQVIAEKKNDIRSKTLKSKNGWAVFDGYCRGTSYRMRITNAAMKQIHNISGSRDSFMRNYSYV